MKGTSLQFNGGGFLEKAGIRYRYRKLDFAQGIFLRVEHKRAPRIRKTRLRRGEDISVQAIELSAGDIALGVKL